MDARLYKYKNNKKKNSPWAWLVRPPTAVVPNPSSLHQILSRRCAPQPPAAVTKDTSSSTHHDAYSCPRVSTFVPQDGHHCILHQILLLLLLQDGPIRRANGYGANTSISFFTRDTTSTKERCRVADLGMIGAVETRRSFTETVEQWPRSLR